MGGMISGTPRQRHIQNGMPLHILQELGGWSGYDMVKRYAHLSSEHLSEFVGNGKVMTNLLHSEKVSA